MCLSDTAEYWADARRSRPFYTGIQYYHIPNANCGRKHHNEAKAIGDVNCRDCLQMIADGYEHSLPEGKTDFRSKSQIKRENKAHKERLELENRKKEAGLCKCGAQRVKRQNRTDKSFFYACSTYPKCKITTSIERTFL